MIALALLAAFLPRVRDHLTVAALGAALLIGMQLTIDHWFYLYIPWFLPFLFLALLGGALVSRYPAGTMIGSIARASPSSPISTDAPITQTSSSAVSKRIGIWVRKACRACSRRRRSRRPGAGHPDVGHVRGAPGRTRASAVGTWVCVPSTAATRPSRCQPIATFSLVSSA